MCLKQQQQLTEQQQQLNKHQQQLSEQQQLLQQQQQQLQQQLDKQRLIDRHEYMLKYLFEGSSLVRSDNGPSHPTTNDDNNNNDGDNNVEVRMRSNTVVVTHLKQLR